MAKAKGSFSILDRLDWISVSSSNIEAIAYMAGKGGTAFVKFHHGGVYSYAGVPADLFASFEASASVGSFFATHIKDNYPTRKLN